MVVSKEPGAEEMEDRITEELVETTVAGKEAETGEEEEDSNVNSL
jgi:hypothetical protein